MAELSFRPQWLLSNSSKGYFPASGWMLVDKTPKLGTQLIPGHPRATMQGALAPWEAASMVHVGTSPGAPLLSSTWWLTPSSPGCSPYGQGVWATLPWVSVHVLPLFPRPCFCKASSPEETHHWSSDLPMEVTSSIESEYPELEEIHQEHWVQIPCFSMLGNHSSPRAVQGKCFNAIHSNSLFAHALILFLPLSHRMTCTAEPFSTFKRWTVSTVPDNYFKAILSSPRLFFKKKSSYQ